MSGAPSPRSTSPASRTSRAFPTQRPSGCAMDVTVQRTCRPQGSASEAISSAAAVACASSAKKPPPPALTSSAIAPAPPAIFLLMIDAAMSPAAGTVPVASRRA